MTETVGDQLNAQERERRAQMLRDEQAFARFTMGARAPIDAIVRDPVEDMRAACEAIAKAEEDEPSTSIASDVAHAIAERIAALKGTPT